MKYHRNNKMRRKTIAPIRLSNANQSKAIEKPTIRRRNQLRLINDPDKSKDDNDDDDDMFESEELDNDDD